MPRLLGHVSFVPEAAVFRCTEHGKPFFSEWHAPDVLSQWQFRGGVEMSRSRLVDQVSAAFFALIPAAFLFFAEFVIHVAPQYQLISVILVAIIGLLAWREIARADEGRPLSREHLLKVISMSGAAVAAIALTGAFFENAKRDQQKVSYQLVLDNCVEATKATAILASTYDPSKVPPDVFENFWRTFYGPLIMTESKDIANEMVELGKAIVAHVKACWKKDDIDKFRQHAIGVAVTCRTRLASGPITAQDFVPQEFLTTSLQNHLNDAMNEAANAKVKFVAVFPGAGDKLGGLCEQ
jgi:hypothetical protein